MKRHLLFICLLLSTFSSFSQLNTKGKRFWVAFIENLDWEINCPPITVFKGEDCGKYGIQILTDTHTIVTISAPQIGYSIPFECKPGEMNVFQLAEAHQWTKEGVELIHKGGILIESDIDVEVIAINNRVFFSEFTYVMPEKLLGRNYTIMAVEDPIPLERSGSAFVVLGIEDHTEVEINPSHDMPNGKRKGVPFRIKLDRGEVYQLRSSVGDLSATTVHALNGKKVAVFSGSKTARNFPDGYTPMEKDNPLMNDNHLYEHLMPDILHGTNYILTNFRAPKISGTPFPTTIKIISLEDENRILVKRVIDTVLSKGETLKFYIDQAYELNSTFPCVVGAISPSISGHGVNRHGDPSLRILKPKSYVNSSWQVIACHLANKIGSDPGAQPENVVQLVFPKGQPSGIKVGSNSIHGMNMVHSYNIKHLDFYIMEFVFGENFTPGKCFYASSEEPFQAYWSTYSRYDAYSTNLGFEIPDSSILSREKIYYSNDEIVLYPNPVVQQKLNIKLLKQSENEHLMKVKLYNMIGQLCSEIDLQTSNDLEEKFTLDLSHLAAAMYVVEIEYNNQSFTEKIIKTGKFD